MDFSSAGNPGQHQDSRGGGGGGILVEGVNRTKISGGCQHFLVNICFMVKVQEFFVAGRGYGAGQGAGDDAEPGCIILEI